MTNPSELPNDFLVFVGFGGHIETMYRYMKRDDDSWDKFRWEYGWQWHDNVGNGTALTEYNSAKQLAIMTKR